MTKDEYIETLCIKGKEVKVGLDDYGQCYFFEYIDDDGKLKTVGCGAYNSFYLEEIYGYFDHKGTMISLYGKDSWDDTTKRLNQRWIEKGWAKDNPKQYQEFLDNRNSDDYEIYDFETMYKIRRNNENYK